MLYDKNVRSDSAGRLYYFDNAKFILIFLVVLAHALSPLQSRSAFCRVAWVVINNFHMPAMIFISGFFAKRYISRAREIKVQRVVTNVLLYLAAQLSVAAFERFVLKAEIGFSLLSARSSLWFLQCLIWWYILLPVLRNFPPKAVMILAVLFGLYVGYEDKANNFLALSRMFVHLPFFMAGYYVKQEQIEQLSARKYKWIGLASFAVVAAVCLIWPRTAIGAIITCNTPYEKIAALEAVPQALQWVARLWFYVAAAALIVGFLAFVPRGRAIFTKLGKETLSVYILHRFLYLAYQQYQWYLPFASPLGIAGMCLIALALTVAFSLKPFTLPFHWLQGVKISEKKKENAA
ncbi:MAG: acyltransferase family protein [Oscillospiraceae bacterium]|jgi:fucose 4-O-acetylase-like acetyltransferase|nr:acyltransferase family protein [Oscillospiraceae bacterium]